MAHAPLSNFAGVTVDTDVRRGPRYRVAKADADHPLVCSVTASNDGGVADAPYATTAMVKIPR